MNKVIVGIESNIPWEYQGRSGLTNRLYTIDAEDQDYTSQRGAHLRGKRIEVVKLPASIAPDAFMPGDEIQVFYNRYGQVEAITPA